MNDINDNSAAMFFLLEQRARAERIVLGFESALFEASKTDTFPSALVHGLAKARGDLAYANGLIERHQSPQD